MQDPAAISQRLNELFGAIRQRASAIAKSPSGLFFAVCLSFILGAAGHALIERPLGLAGPLFTASAAFAAVAGIVKKNRAAIFFCAVIAAVIAGAARYDAALASLPPAEKLGAGVHRFRGRLDGEPKRGIHDTVLKMDRVVVLEPENRRLSRSMIVKARVSVAARHGDILEWRCAPRPEPPAGSAAAEYFFLRRISAMCFSRDLRVVGHESSPKTVAALYDFKARVRRTADVIFPEPDASLLLGLLIGDRDGIPRELQQSFRLTGTSHILAVSGYNVSKIIAMFIILCALIGLRRRLAAALSAAGLAGFIAIVGSEASVVRSAIMGATGILAAISGRRYSMARSLVIAAALMLAANPFMLRHDVGFQLSFAALMGISAFARAFARRMKWLPEIAGIRKAFSESAAAALATAPISLHAFGALSIIGPLINVLILPVVPAAMFFGAAALALGLAHPAFAAVPAASALIILRFIESIAAASAAAFPFPLRLRIGLAEVLLLYVWMIIFWYWIKKHERRIQKK